MDLEELATILGVEIEDYLELLVFFHESSFVELAKMEKAFSKGSAGDVLKVAHSIKASALNLEMKRISDICEEIEMQVRDSDMEGLGPFILTLREELENLADMMKRTAIGE
jgi:HPt (histidine-containing phosphotransfer) domain-containing protein